MRLFELPNIRALKAVLDIEIEILRGETATNLDLLRIQDGLAGIGDVAALVKLRDAIAPLEMEPARAVIGQIANKLPSRAGDIAHALWKYSHEDMQGTAYYRNTEY